MAVTVVNEKQMSLFVLFRTKDRMLQKTGILSGNASDEELWRRWAGLGNLINPLTHQHTAHVWQHEEWKTRKSEVGMSLSSRLVLSIPSLWGVLFLAFSPPLHLFTFSSFFLQTLRNATNHPSRLNPRQPFWTLTFGLFGFPEYCSYPLNKEQTWICDCVAQCARQRLKHFQKLSLARSLRAILTSGLTPDPYQTGMQEYLKRTNVQ